MLVQHLTKYGTMGLENRRQIVVVDGEKSEIEPIAAGVPQGSKLGPLLFLIYINDITENLESVIYIFADDTTILASGNNPTETSQILNRDLDKITTWASTWKVKFNAGKSKDMIFTKQIFNNVPPIIFNNEEVKRVTEHKHLGVYLTYNLDWGYNVQQVCLKANRKLSVLRRVKCLQRSTLDILYKLIDYCLPLYFHTLKLTEIKKLNRIQYRAAKLVSGALHLSSADRLNKELGWETISDRAKCLGLTLFHKIHRGETRPLITKLMPIKNQRSNANYIQYPNKKQYYNKYFFPHFTKLWNNLSN